MTHAIRPICTTARRFSALWDTNRRRQSRNTEQATARPYADAGSRDTQRFCDGEIVPRPLTSPPELVDKHPRGWNLRRGSGSPPHTHTCEYLMTIASLCFIKNAAKPRAATVPTIVTAYTTVPVSDSHMIFSETHSTTTQHAAYSYSTQTHKARSK